MGIAEWIGVAVAIIGAVGAIAKLGKDRWTLQRVVRATAKAIQRFKEDMAADDDPEIAKALTTRIKANVEAAGVTKAHEHELAKAGANVAAILAPAIARLARPAHGAGGA